MQTNFNDIKQFKDALEKKFNETFTVEPVIYHRLDEIPDLTGKEDEFYHFGVLTLGDTFSYKENHPNPLDEEQKIKEAVFYSGHSPFPFVSVLPNSQIFDFFKIIHVRDTDGDLIIPQTHKIYGHFRGFIVYPQDVIV